MSSIELFHSWAYSHVNYEKGTEVRGAGVAFYNCSGKEIKYISFEFVPLNAVNDVCDEIKIGKETGPIAINSGHECEFDFMWSNVDITTTELKSATIEYMDGTTEHIDSDDLVNIFTKSLPKSSACERTVYRETIYHLLDNEYPKLFGGTYYSAREYEKGRFEFNEDSTFYKNYNESWKKKVEEHNRSKKKSDIAGKIGCFIGIAIPVAIIIAIVIWAS